MKSNKYIYSAFTIVELLVVVVIIAVLAAISLVMYSGISQKAVASILQSDLSNAATALKAFQVENSNYPTTISTDCTANPDSSTNKCLKVSGGNSFVGYYVNNSTVPKTFQLTAANNNNLYKVTDSLAPAQVTSSTMQPNVTPGALVELHAAKAVGGTGTGINSPLTTTWYDTSGSSNSGILSGASGQTPWGGSGTGGDPYKVLFDASNDYVSLGIKRFAETKMFTFETWVITPSVIPANYLFSISEAGPTPQGGTAYPIVGITLVSGTGRARLYYRDGLNNNPAIYGPANGICDGLIHHIVATSSNSTATMYVDGVAGTPVNVSSIVTGSMFKLDYATSVGRAAQGQYYWDGSIIAARIYPYTLTAAQVTANYNAGVVW